MLVAVEGVGKKRVYFGGQLFVFICADAFALLIAYEGARKDKISLGDALLFLCRVGDVFPCAKAFTLLIADEGAWKDEPSLGGALFFHGRIGDHADVLFIGIGEAPKVVLRVPLLLLALRHVEASIFVADEGTWMLGNCGLRVQFGFKGAKLHFATTATERRIFVAVVDGAIRGEVTVKACINPKVSMAFLGT